jgi:hypothetical protein
MPVALVDFEALYGGELVKIPAGEMCVDSHELVRRFPDRFRPDAPKFAKATRKPRRRSVTAWPAAGHLTPPVAPVTARDEREIPELRATASPTVTVQLGRFARATIDEEIAWSRELLETYDSETGGWLFGQRQSGGVWHLSATRLGAKGERKPNSVLLDYAEAKRWAREIRQAEAGLRFVGSWHSHPGWDETKPSSTDRANMLWRIGWQELDATPFSLALIVTPDRERGWRRLHFNGWATRRNQFGTAVTEPARILP